MSVPPEAPSRVATDGRKEKGSFQTQWVELQTFGLTRAMAATDPIASFSGRGSIPESGPC
jgi:hypothetical protein